MSSISFPLGIAKDPYFCNRKDEIKQLLRNINNCTHTVLISPRRYGKTSLAYRAILQSKFPYASVDLYMATSAVDISRAILFGVNDLLNQINNHAEAMFNLIKDYIKSLKPTFEASHHGLKLKLEMVDADFSTSAICEALQILDRVLNKKRMKAILFIDEFQEIDNFSVHHSIEGAIRHVAQETKCFVLIFSGSHRHLLKRLFNDKSKPLFRLCDEIFLERISEKDYLPFLEKFSKKQWNISLPLKLVKKILDYSECHSYYFNAICDKLFSNANLPSEKDVDEIWKNLITQKRKDMLIEIKTLTITQKKLLVSIAHGINHELTGQKFLGQAELSGASVVRGLEYLEENDFIEKINRHYRLIDPLLKSIINQSIFL